jgi:hypothetical protein
LFPVDEAKKIFCPPNNIRLRSTFPTVIAGPLAEAKALLLCDNEPFKPNRVNVCEQQLDGNASDLEIVDEPSWGVIGKDELRKKNELRLEAGGKNGAQNATGARTHDSQYQSPKKAYETYLSFI